MMSYTEPDEQRGQVNSPMQYGPRTPFSEPELTGGERLRNIRPLGFSAVAMRNPEGAPLF
jgi:hypothetical protein